MKKLELSMQFHKKQITSELELLMEIESVIQDWLAAQTMFQWAIEEETIDLAIYKINTAEYLYALLLRQAKKISLTFTPNVYQDSPLRIIIMGNIYYFPKKITAALDDNYIVKGI